MIFRARQLLPMDGSPAIDDGGIQVIDGQIQAVGRFRDLVAQSSDGVTDLGETILMPGLINAHCHLDFTVMRGAILRPTSFSAWIKRINELKRTLTDDDYLASIASGLDELKTWGVTSVLNIESFPELMLRMPPPPIRTWWFYELMDIRTRIHTEDVVAGALSFFESHQNWMGGFGLSPHAPFTTSLRLYELSRFCAEKYGMPFTTHLSETDEEMDMFANARGPMWEFLTGLGRNMDDTGSRTPIRHLLDANVLPDGAILAHMNQLGAGDVDALRDHAGRFSIVHCPNCHDFFSRPPFPYETLHKLFPISLGTDSCASNFGLNLFSEMQTFQRTHPAVSPEEIVRMVTTNPAAALRRAGTLGVLAPGAVADFIAIPDPCGSADVHTAVVENRTPPHHVFVAGQRA